MAAEIDALEEELGAILDAAEDEEEEVLDKELEALLGDAAAPGGPPQLLTRFRRLS